MSQNRVKVLSLDFFYFFEFFIFFNYESMMTHLQETGKMQDKVTYSSTSYYNFFKVDKLRFFSQSFNVKLSKINRMNVQRCRRI